MKVAAAILILLCLPAVVAAAMVLNDGAPAAPPATPLLELEARGIRTTDVFIPFCGEACVGTQPRFLSYRIAITTGGRYAGTLTVTTLDDPASRPSIAMFEGLASGPALDNLRALLAAARVGLEPGGCTVAFGQPVPDQPHPTQHAYQLSYAVLWYGQLHRTNRFELPRGSAPCGGPLGNLIRHIVFLPPHGQ